MRGIKIKPLLGLAALLALPLVSSAVAQSGLDDERSLIVKLRIHRPQQSDETAAALLVGRDERVAYFITAYHALGPNSQGVNPSSVDIQFYASPQSLPASIFESYDGVLDLGVVFLPVKNLPAKLPRIAKANPAADAQIRIIGHPSAGGWSVWSGIVQNENATNNDPRHFCTNKDESLSDGYSGAPVFDSQGRFLGMHVETQQSYGVSAKSGDIFAQLAAWRIPTNNFTTTVDGTLDSAQQDREAINRLLDSYQDLYGRRDAAHLWNLWPDAPPQTKRAIENYFHNARSLTRRVSDRNIDLKTSRATVTGRCLDEFTPINGSSLKSDDPITLEMEKRNNNWIIVSVK